MSKPNMQNNRTITLETDEYKLNPPTIYQSNLFPTGNVCDPDEGSLLDMCTSMIVAFSGPRGGGKTLSLTYAAIKALAGGLDVWLNYPLAFYYVRDLAGKKEPELLQAKLLDLKEFLAMKSNVRGGLIGLDEYQDIASAYSFNSTKNRLLAATWAQIRKLDLSFYYTSKFHKWVDTRTRDELDVELACVDAYRTPWGKKRYGRGEVIFWQMADWSGMATGYQFEQNPILRPFKLYGKPFWGAYPTRFRIDIFESLRGMQLDLQKDVISDKFETSDLNYEEIVYRVKGLFERLKRWRPNDLWEELQVFSRKEQQAVKRILRNALGVVDSRSGGVVFLTIDPHAKEVNEAVV